MYWNKQTIDLQGKICRITPLADIHWGNNNCKKHKLIRTVDYIKNEPDHYVFGMGDWWDSILFNDKRASHGDKCGTMDEEYNKLKQILLPIKDRIIMVAEGNHEIRLEQWRIGSPIRRLSDEWNILYGGYSGFLRLSILRKGKGGHWLPLVIYYHHGASSGRKTGGAVNRVEELSQYWGADVYCMAHNHKLWATAEPFIDWSGDRPLYFCNTGGFLETSTVNETGYGEIKQYNPLRLGTNTIKWQRGNNAQNQVEISEYIKV